MAGDATFSGVVVVSMLDSGETKPKYEHPICVKTAYDPNGVSVTVQSGMALFQLYSIIPPSVLLTNL